MSDNIEKRGGKNPCPVKNLLKQLLHKRMMTLPGSILFIFKTFSIRTIIGFLVEGVGVGGVGGGGEGRGRGVVLSFILTRLRLTPKKVHP